LPWLPYIRLALPFDPDLSSTKCTNTKGAYFSPGCFLLIDSWGVNCRAQGEGQVWVSPELLVFILHDRTVKASFNTPVSIGGYQPISQEVGGVVRKSGGY